MKRSIVAVVLTAVAVIGSAESASGSNKQQG